MASNDPMTSRTRGTFIDSTDRALPDGLAKAMADQVVAEAVAGWVGDDVERLTLDEQAEMYAAEPGQRLHAIASAMVRADPELRDRPPTERAAAAEFTSLAMAQSVSRSGREPRTARGLRQLSSSTMTSASLALHAVKMRNDHQSGDPGRPDPELDAFFAPMVRAYEAVLNDRQAIDDTRRHAGIDVAPTRSGTASTAPAAEHQGAKAQHRRNALTRDP